MFLSKVVLFVVFSIFILIDDSTQFLVANCVWDDALTGFPINGLKGFVISDADACALFCSKTGVGGVQTASSSGQSSTKSVPSIPSAALCDRCCKSSQPPSKPGELIVSILQTLVSAFGPTKPADSQNSTPSQGAGVEPGAKPGAEPDAGNGDSVNKPSSGRPTPKPPATPAGDEEYSPIFGDPEDAATTVINGDGNRKVANFFYRDPKNYDFEPSDGPLLSAAEHRQNRAAYPEARILEITGRDKAPTYRNNFEQVANQGPGWPHPGAGVPLQSRTIR